jgi:4-coumarate--CoA ligase
MVTDLTKANQMTEIFTSAETGRTYTYDALRQTAVQFGKGLQSQWRWQRGDVLAVYSPNSIDLGAVVLGAIWAGAVVSPANPLYTPEELSFQLRDADAKGLVTQRPFLGVALDAARRAGLAEDRVLLIGEERDPDGRFVHFDELKPGGPGLVASLFGSRRARVDPKRELAFLVYSSGTTGLPKGVCLSHYNLVANILQFSAVEGREFHPDGGVDGKGDKQLGIVPFFHIYVS